MSSKQVKHSHSVMKIRDKEERLISLLSPFESYILLVERILVWELPYASAVLIIAVHILFWLATTLRIYYLFGVTCMVLVILDMWITYLMPNAEESSVGEDTNSGWTELHPRLLGVPELSHHIAERWVQALELLDTAIALRTNNRPRFFVLSIIYLTLLAIVGAYVPGLWIAYLSVMGVLIWPCFKYHSIYDRLHTAIEPSIRNIETKLNIKRTRSSNKGVSRKRNKGQLDVAEESSDVRVQQTHTEPQELVTGDASDSDDALLDEFLPSLNPTVMSALTAALNTDYIDDDDDELEQGILSRLTPELSLSREHSDDELLGDEMLGLGREMPSITDVDGYHPNATNDEFQLSDRFGDASLSPEDVDVSDTDDSLPADGDEMEIGERPTERHADTDSEVDEDNFAAGLRFTDDTFDADASSSTATSSVLSNLLGQGSSTLVAALTSPTLSGLMSSAASGLTTLREVVGRGSFHDVRPSAAAGPLPRTAMPRVTASQEGVATAQNSTARTDSSTVSTHTRTDSEILDAEFEFLNEEELTADDDSV